MQKKITKHAPYLGSSIDPNKISRTLKNLGVFVVALAALKGINIPETEIDLYITAIMAIISGATTIYYGIMRGINWLKEKGYLKK